MQTIYDKVIEYGKTDRESMGPAECFWKDARKHAAVVCQADETHFLVNGTTAGILSAVFSAAEQGV